jgi:hypothetical protein
MANAIIIRGRRASLLRRVLHHPAIVPVAFCLGLILSLISFSVFRAWERSSSGFKEFQKRRGSWIVLIAGLALTGGEGG